MGNIFALQRVPNNISKPKESHTDQNLDDEERQKQLEEEEQRKKQELEEERRKEREEELKKDERMMKFITMSDEDKDEVCCDEIFSLYLRDLSKRVNENYYKTVLRFIILYRECLNEYGWLKRRDHYMKVEMLDQDKVLNKLKAKEEEEEKIAKQ
jgi:hypothetical protein